MKKRNFLARYVLIGAVFLVVCFIYLLRLADIQVTGQDYYSAGKALVYKERRVVLYAERGEIFDRNGVPLVTNRYSYSICLDAGSMPDDNGEANRLILNTINEGISAGAVFERPDVPLKYAEGKWNISGDLTVGRGRRLVKILEDMNVKNPDSPDPETAARALLVRFGLASYADKKFVPPDDMDSAMLLFDVRLDMLLSDFSEAVPYKILGSVGDDLIIRLKEGSVRGILVRSEAERVFEIPGLASHILGRVGKIQAENAEYYTEKGYPLDAVVGISGAEYAFENYLHGVNGTLVIVEDSMGNTVDSYVETEPVPGRDVYLTIDSKLQSIAETALSDNIKYIVANAVAGGKPHTGEDADAGALTVINANTGEVLALASNPTYDLSTFNEDYSELSSDPLSPMLNRALSGNYTPGSTFKVGVAAAALNENIITPNTIINATGVYTYYEDSGFTPRCWINLLYGGSHGPINVTKAIQVSCNYFFYEVGRLLTINTMNEYCRSYGLGMNTGIELPESTGVLAGPDYRAENGLGAWSPGDTVQAAIGQIENAFTPLQLSVYISTILRGGTRVGAHLLKEVREYAADTPIYEAKPVIVSEKALSPEVVSVVKGAMQNVTEDDGSAARLFQNYPIKIGGKTGTAQVSENQSDHAVFVAFAPFDDPEIVASCVIEKGAGGTDAGFSVRDVFTAYFGIEYEDGFDQFQKELREEEDNIDDVTEDTDAGGTGDTENTGDGGDDLT